MLIFGFQPFRVFVCVDSQEQDAVQSRRLHQDPEDCAYVALQEETQGPVRLHPVPPPSPDTGTVVVVWWWLWGWWWSVDVCVGGGSGLDKRIVDSTMSRGFI